MYEAPVYVQSYLFTNRYLNLLRHEKRCQMLLRLVAYRLQSFENYTKILDYVTDTDNVIQADFPTSIIYNTICYMEHRLSAVKLSFSD